MAQLPAEQKAELGQDLQSFIRFLEKHYPDEVLRVKREVDPVFEATAILWRLERERRFPLVIFDDIKGSDIPCVTNVHASFPRLAMAIGLGIDATPRDFVLEYMKREDQPIEPKLVDRASAPCKEVVLTGEDVDVFTLPMLKYHELGSGAMDPGYEAHRGRYVTLGYEVMKDPDTGVRNAGIYRLQAKGRNKFGIQISETAHGHYIMQKNIKRGQPTPMAVAIGLHPAVELGFLSFTSIDVDEFSIAGAMIGEPLQMVKCETIDVEVPAWAEIVLECEIDPQLREPEAPFGEYPGTYGPERNNPVVWVKAITMRRNAHYQSSFVGHRDNLLLSGVTRNSQIYKTCRIASGAVKAVYVPPSGRSRYICYVAMEKLIEGDPKNAAMAAFTADPFLKYVVVVDDDVDITNDADVLHAIATRVRWDHDAFVVTYARGSPVGISLPRQRVKQYPHEFSGGMRQRVMIAMGLACDPELLIADEPTTALDVTIQAQILELMADIQQELGLSLLLITHDLGVVAGLCHRIEVMYAGKIVESGPAVQVFERSGHPYTTGLLRSTPRLDIVRPRLVAIDGVPPDLIAPPSGCPFHPRCPLVVDRCVAEMPPLESHEGDREVACWRAFAAVAGDKAGAGASRG